jgi:ABC-2 type transport system ATP-binding protein
MSPAIEVTDLTKRYGDLRAVDGVSFSVEPGEVFAILGPNGAGKSTTVEILEGHRKRDGGSVSVLGLDPAKGGREYRNRVGIVLQSAGIDKELSVREVLDLYATAYTRRRPVDEVLEAVELTEKADARVRSLSGGQQRRVDLALGLIGDPELIFLDEPTTGFDPAARRRSWDLVRNLTADGTTVVLTTHYLEEAEQLADRVAVMSGGRIVAEGTPEALRANADTGTVIRFALPAVNAPLSELLDPLVGDASGRDRRIEIVTLAPTADLAHITAWALGHGIELQGLVVESMNLEDVYLQLVGDDSGEVAT